ncbi:hypothetical protein SPRG_05848 [Saprolegnia parasitica CBS 223.65]|uniref:CAP-Gly domain-containing protein n=1 Tax=Saprolegnia parasitica (strain CBS 223.65) TaxID=695850 RepID=A0A067CS16_SAPPC|nr:hypothetical protein SPRG_05848 [Saprolegnia parasitica CBS 223.65]KDO29311.1 hypothetical protein SPRG_05848 [Saprolegnia parasitica CBS 223.65]|eukprot:XP_012199818.1 hypothetical protein SPRG_05848 [Saprolegnia parasitica CBS 223.65]
MSATSFVNGVATAMETIKKHPDDWQKRQAALQDIQDLFVTIGTATMTVPPEAWRLLKPLKDVITDLRSQMVKAVCTILAIIARVSRDSMAPLARELLPVLLDVRGGGNKVCGTYCGECADFLVANVVTKGPTLRYFVEMVTESRNKNIREACISLLALVLVHWSAVLDKNDVTQIEVGLKAGLQDASSSVRAHALVLYQRFTQKFSKRAIVLFNALDPKIQRRLESLPLVDAMPSMAYSASNSIDENTEFEDKVESIGHDMSDERDVDVGDRVCISEKELFGTVRFIGDVIGFQGLWLGVELDTPSGKNDGSIKGEYYFRCEDKYGVFVRPTQVFLTKRHMSFDGGDVARSSFGDASEHTLGETTEPDAEAAAMMGVPDTENDPPLKKLLDSVLDAQRGFLDFMFLNLNVEMDHLDVFQKSSGLASSADAIAYCDQVRNICQEKLDAVNAFMEKIVEAQQKAMET